MFHFNEDFVAAMAGGLSDDDTLGIFVDAVEAGGAVMATHVQQKAGEEFDVYFEDGAFEVDLSEDQWEREIGSPRFGPPNPRVRNALIAGAPFAAKAMEEVMNDA